MKYVIFTFVIFLIACEPVELSEIENYELNSVYSEYTFNDSTYTTDSFYVVENSDFILSYIGQENLYSYGVYYNTYIENQKIYLDTLTNFSYKIPLKTGGFVNGSVNSNPNNTSEYTTTIMGNNILIDFRCEIYFDSTKINILDTLYILEGSLELEYINL